MCAPISVAARPVEGERFAWEQLIPGTPFERHLRRYEVEISLSDEGDGTR